MTTQHTHHDHGDVDTSVVEYSPTPENAVNPANAEPTSPSEEEDTASTPSSELAAPTEVPEESHDVSAVAQVEEPSQAEVPVTEAQEQDHAEAHISVDVGPEPVFHNVEEHTTFSYSDTPSLEEKSEEVRPFTDFIEQFRQAEVARLQATLRESQIEAFSLLAPVEAQTPDFQAPVPTPPLDTEVPATAVPSTSVPPAEEASPAAEFVAAQEPENPAAVEAAPAPENEATPAAQGVEEGKTKEGSEKTEPAGGHPVSPLLRPAARLRPSRHTSRQHAREEAREEAQKEATPSEAAPVEAQTPPAPVETPTEPPRPTRRYRFDRPAATNGVAHTTTTSPSRVEENRVSPPSPARAEATVSEPATETRPAEQQTQKQPAVQETSPATSSAPHAPTEQGRRRAQKEQQPATATPPITEPAAPVQETPAQEEIAPEDLPPLEYSELQKASSRRRRRHRSGSSNGTTAAIPTSGIAPVPPTAPAPTTPAAPQTPAPANPASYTIVSGYTVNQMNQGNDLTGPFMAPEPSPARGSVFTRESRSSARSEAHRGTSPSYPTPIREGSSASLTHFANIVSQAIQTQTDRMVAELHRVGQTPTNVSVTLPPFPSTERVGVFVDVANLLYSARTLRMTVDFGKLLDFLRGNRRLVRAHAYCPTSPQPGEEQMFLQAVKGLGYRITTKNYKTFSSGAKKADLDLDLCMDVVRLVDGKAVDCVVLVSGDSDFMPMLDYCSDHGVRVEVAAFDEAMSATLRQSCDLFINLSMLEEIRS